MMREKGWWFIFLGKQGFGNFYMHELKDLDRAVFPDMETRKLLRIPRDGPPQ